MDAAVDLAAGGICDDVRALASLALDGALADDVGERLLRRHVSECAACAQFVADVGVFTDLLRRAPLAPYRSPPIARTGLGATTAHRAHWATMAAAIVAVTVGVASLPQSSPPAPPVPDDAARVDAPVKLPIGQRSAESDFADSSPVSLWA